ncbi:MAG: hypothetical protein AAGF12_29075 [Myxococcota bacterium]
MTYTPHVHNDEIVFGKGVRVSFQRTLRIPDDGRTYPLPPGLGRFPIRRVEDYADRVPTDWRDKGGVFLPMYQREAMWLSFRGQHYKPRAIKIGIGKVCAITGKEWSNGLRDKPQDYVVAPLQPWLDGIATGKGTIRQFVAMPLGMGYTVEGQLTGKEDVGGVQLKVFEPRPGIFPDAPPTDGLRQRALSAMMPMCAAPAPPAAGGMGLAAGGRMKQKIYPDPHGIETWDSANCARIFIHLANSAMWREITGEAPPSTPVTAKEYARHGLPWFDLYDEGAATLDPPDKLAGVASVKELDQEKFGTALQDDGSVEPNSVKKIGQPVHDGKW